MRLKLSSVKDRCTLGQTGLVLDFSSRAILSRKSFRLWEEESPVFTTRLGERFRKLDQMNEHFVFWLTEDMEEFEFTARVHGSNSERLAVYIDNQRLGAARLKKNDTKVVRISGRDKVIARGRHKLTLSLSRPRRGEVSGEISWLRLGARDRQLTDFPGTRRELFSEVTIEKEREKSLVLRPSSMVRCPVWLPEKTSLKTQFGVWGQGPAELEVIVHTAQGEHVTVAQVRREKDDPRKFVPLSADLRQFGSQLVDIEFRAPHRPGGARVALAEPTLENEAPAFVTSPRASRAIVIVLSGLSERHSPPQAGENGLPFFNQLAKEGTSFSSYRNSTTSATGTLASMLTGLPPWQHRLEDIDFPLSPDLLSLAATIEDQGGRSSFFTGVPTGFSQFGFNRGFELFTQVGPQEDKAATAPLELAQQWLTSHLNHEGPVLSFVQLRGAHPPFDLSRDEERDLPPEEYGGELNARRAALQLAKIRGRRMRRHRRMPQDDWSRLHALEKAALLKQSAALSDFLKWLRENDAYNDTLLILVGDIGSEKQPAMPYGSDAPLDEENLALPLLVKFPHSHLSGKHTDGLFAPRDLATTVLSALGLEKNHATSGIDLGASNATRLALLRPHIAFRNDVYSLRLGSALLRGKNGHAPSLCRPALDPSCLTDRSKEDVLTARGLWRITWSELSDSLAKTQKQERIDYGDDEDDARKLSQDSRAREKKALLKNALIVWGLDP